jgi:hypothetical protein
MLNKELCLRCYLENSSDIEKGPNGFGLLVRCFRWTESVERWWMAGKVVCPSKVKDDVGFVNTADSPPYWCPYALEHTVSGKH